MLHKLHLQLSSQCETSASGAPHPGLQHDSQRQQDRLHGQAHLQRHSEALAQEASDRVCSQQKTNQTHSYWSPHLRCCWQPTRQVNTQLWLVDIIITSLWLVEILSLYNTHLWLVETSYNLWLVDTSYYSPLIGWNIILLTSDWLPGSSTLNQKISPRSWTRLQTRLWEKHWVREWPTCTRVSHQVLIFIYKEICPSVCMYVCLSACNPLQQSMSKSNYKL